MFLGCSKCGYEPELCECSRAESSTPPQINVGDRVFLTGVIVGITRDRIFFQPDATSEEMELRRSDVISSVMDINQKALVRAEVIAKRASRGDPNGFTYTLEVSTFWGYHPYSNYMHFKDYQVKLDSFQLKDYIMLKRPRNISGLWKRILTRLFGGQSHGRS